MPGEEVWPTQPFPLKPPPFARQEFTGKDLSPFMDEQEREHFRNEIRSARNQGMFTPPGLTNTIEMPGNNGGANWGGAAVDPRNGTLYVVSKDLPCMLKLEPEKTVGAERTGTSEQRGRLVYEANCQQCHGADGKGQPPAVPSLIGVSQTLTPEQIRSVMKQGQGPMPAFSQLSEADLNSLVSYLEQPQHGVGIAPAATISTKYGAAQKHYVSGFGFLFTKAGLPPIAPPWTTLTAYDLNNGTIKWQMPLGEVPELEEKGIKGTGGIFQKTGPVVTAGRIIFIGTRDRMVRAIDEETGKVLWEAQVGAAAAGIPAVYELNGKEYLVVCAAERSAVNPATHETVHGAYVAFALPDSVARR
jgi:quinoprotein glucose dehydrogenase